MAVKRKIIGSGSDGLTEVAADAVTAGCYGEIADSGLLAPRSRKLHITGFILAGMRLLSEAGREAVGEILNSPTSCEGPPEGVVNGRPGRTCWDTENQVQYVKQSGEAKEGWIQLIGI